MMPQEAAAIAAVVWRLVQFCVAEQLLRKIPTIIQIHILCFFIKSPSSNPKCATQPNIYMTWKIIRSGENRISAFVFPYQDKGPRFTFDQAADACGDFLAEAGRRLR